MNRLFLAVIGGFLYPALSSLLKKIQHRVNLTKTKTDAITNCNETTPVVQPRHPRIHLGTTTPTNEEVKKAHYEKLRDQFHHLDSAWETVFRYGNSGFAFEFMKDLDRHDQILLLTLAIIEGRWIQKRTALKMLRILNNDQSDLKGIFQQLSSDDLEELSRVRARKKGQDLPGEPAARMMDSGWRDRVKQELLLVVRDMSDLTYEEGVCVLIPPDPKEVGIWVRTVTPPPHGLTLNTETHFDPSDAQRHELISRMRKAQWILSIHNHPGGFGHSPSREDIGHSFWWREIRPELRDKMKFFIVAENDAWEYSLPENEVVPWKVSENKND